MSVNIEIPRPDGERLRRLVALLRWRGIEVDVKDPAASEPVRLAVQVPHVQPGVAREALSRLAGLALQA
jgi:hypothetical protein